MPVSAVAASNGGRSLRSLFPRELPLSLRWAAGAYLLHILSVGRIALAESLFGIMLLASIVAIRRRHLSIAPDPLHFALQLFAAGSVLSAMLSRHPLHSFSSIANLLWLTSIPVGAAVLASHRDLQDHARRALVALSVFLSIYGIIEFFARGHSWKNVEQRITGPTPHVMTYSGIILALSLYFFADALGRRKALSWIAAVLPATALALTLTRGAWIGWGIGIGLLLLRRAPRAFIWAIPLAILAFTFAPLPIFARVVSVFDMRQESNFDRVQMARAGVEMIRDEPMTGVGPGEVKALYPLYREPSAPRFAAPHLHNNIIQIWAETGILALAGYLLLIVLFLVRCWRVDRLDDRRTAADCGLVAIAGMSVAGVFEYNFGDAEVLFTQLAIMALTVAALRSGAATSIREAAASAPGEAAL